MPGPTAWEAASLGLTLEEAQDAGAVEVWPDCWDSVIAFDAIATQWRYSTDGPTSLDYAAIQPAFELMDLPRRKWADMFKDIRTMEDAALKLFAFQREHRK